MVGEGNLLTWIRKGVMITAFVKKVNIETLTADITLISNIQKLTEYDLKKRRYLVTKPSNISSEPDERTLREL